MKSYKIHLIRHGLTTANAQGYYAGRTDTVLTGKGREELHGLLNAYEYPYAEWVISSPAAQAMQTAEILYPAQEIRRDRRWQEMDFGVFDGKSLEELSHDPRYAAWMEHPASAPPEGESSQQVFARVLEGLEGLFADMMEAGVFSAAVVTHGGIISGLLATLGLPQEAPGHWSCPCGQGYTILMTPQMWMRSRQFEIFSVLPLEPEQDRVQSEDDWEDMDLWA